MKQVLVSLAVLLMGCVEVSAQNPYVYRGYTCVQNNNTCTYNAPASLVYDACEQPLDYAVPGTQLYKALVSFPTNYSIQFVNGASRLMTAGARDSLVNLEIALNSSSFAIYNAQIRVRRAWTGKTNANTPPNLFNVGQSVEIEMFFPINNTISMDVAYFGSMALDAGFTVVESPVNNQGRLILSVRPDNCQSFVDILFVIDSSGSISSYWTQELSFVAKVVEYFSVGLNETRVAAIRYGSSSSIMFNFNAYSSTTAAASAVRSISYTGGGTNTASALDLATTMFTSTAYGARSFNSGVPRVCVLVTDGQSNSRTATIAAGERLKAENVNVFSVGAGNVNSFELEAVATDPDIDHVFLIKDTGKIETLVEKIAGSSCDQPAIVNPGITIEETIEPGAFKFYRPQCAVLTDIIVLEQRDLNGSTNVYVSGTDRNPGPFNNDIAVQGGNLSEKVLSIDRNALGPNGTLYISVQGVSDGVASSFVLDVFNNIYAEGVNTQVQVNYSSAINPGTSIYTPPALNTTLTQNANVTYRLTTNTSDFFINTLTGEVLTLRTVQPRPEGYQLLIVAEAGTDKCIRGGLGVKIAWPQATLKLSECPANINAPNIKAGDTTTLVIDSDAAVNPAISQFEPSFCSQQCFCTAGAMPKALTACAACTGPTDNVSLISRESCCISCCVQKYYMKLTFKVDYDTVIQSASSKSTFMSQVRNFIFTESVQIGKTIPTYYISNINLKPGSVVAETTFDSNNVKSGDVTSLATTLDNKLKAGTTLTLADGTVLESVQVDAGVSNSTTITQPSSNSSDGLATGVIIGIVVGLLLFICCVALLVFFVCCAGCAAASSSGSGKHTQGRATENKMYEGPDDPRRNSTPMVANPMSVAENPDGAIYAEAE